jgi:hypothetical protein
MSKAPHIIIIVIILMFAVLTGCEAPADTPADVPYPAAAANPAPTEGNPGYPAPAASTPVTSTSGTPAAGYPAPSSGTLRITSAGGQTKPLAVADLAQLTQAVVETRSGPMLGDVLQLAGIKDFAAITVTGSNGSLELTKANVTDQVIIVLDNNTFTLVVAGTPQEQWIKEISTIVVK